MALTQRLEFRQSPVAGDDAAADAGDQAAAAVQSRPVGLRRGANWSAIRCWSAPATAPSRRSRASRLPSGRVCRRRGPCRRRRGRPESRMAPALRRRLRAAQEDWMNRDLGSRTEIEQTLDTPLDNVFHRRAGRGRRAHRAGRGADRLHRMGRRRLQRRQLQSRSLRRRRGDARQTISPSSSRWPLPSRRSA